MKDKIIKKYFLFACLFFTFVNKQTVFNFNKLLVIFKDGTINNFK